MFEHNLHIWLNPDTVYTIYFAYRYFRDFGLGGEFVMAYFCDFCDVFITMNSHILKWEYSRRLTLEIHENKNKNTVSDGPHIAG